MKVKLILDSYMEFPSKNEIKPARFHSCVEINLDGMNDEDLCDTMVGIILENIAKFMAMGSDVRFHSIMELELHTVSYKPLIGATYVPLPKELVNKNAIINIPNTDNKCFLWCVLRALNPKEIHPERVDEELKGKIHTLNTKGIEYPVSLKDIKKFEKQNPNVSITVMGYTNGKGVYPLRNSDNTDREHNIVLLLIEQDGVKHYCLVKNLSRLMGSQVSKQKEKNHICLRCLNPFPCEESLIKHREYCDKKEAVKIEMPKNGTMLDFKHYYLLEKVPFIVYADFECFIKPLESCELNPENSYTIKYQKHEPFSFCYYIKCFDDKVYKPKLISYTGKDAAKKFVEMLEKDNREITHIPKRKMIFGEKQNERFENETKCWICNGKFNDDDVKVLYHKIRFIDSFKFMAASLDSLVKNLPKEDFGNVKRYYEGDKLKLVTRKGVYPYKYIPERLKETQLPPRKAFNSRLNDASISNEDYKHAHQVWKVFNMKNIKEYHKLYNIVDVLLLANVFENFRSLCIKNYNLDPAHYYTAPGLAWDAALKFTCLLLV